MKIIRKVIGTLLLITAMLITQIPVVEIGATASSDFQMDGNTLVKYIGKASSVSIPDNVKTIGREAFAGNQNLTLVKLGQNVKIIEQGAFQDCSYLSEVTLNDSLIAIGNGAFSNNSSLKNFHLTKNISEIGSGVFSGCKFLASLTVDKDNSSFIIDKNALYDSKKEVLISYIPNSEGTEFLMPNTVKRIDEYAFWGNNKLERIALSNNLEEISAFSFSNCKKLTSISIPYSVKMIDTKAFENCIALGMVEIPASVGYIHTTAFDGCPLLIIKAEEGSTGYDFYQNWKSSYSVSGNMGAAIGNTVVDVSGKVYIVDSEGKLVEVKNDAVADVSSGTVPAMHDPSNVDYIPLSDPLLEQEDGILGKTMVVGQNATVLIDPRVPIVNNLTSRSVMPEEEAEAQEIAESDEKGDALPKYAVVNDHITDYAYYQDTDLRKYSIPVNITSIGDFAFARTNLESIAIPNGVKSIGYAAFYHCDNLNEISIPSTVTWIEPSAFAYSGWLNNWANNQEADNFLIVGDGILIAYKGTDSYVNIPEGVETIAPGCFISHNEITGVNIPDSVTVIGEEAFKDCVNLTALHGAKYVKKIQDRAFENTNLMDISIGEYVEEIGLGAFAMEGTQARRVTFAGNNPIRLVHTQSTGKLGNKNSKTPAFTGNWTAATNLDDRIIEDTIFEDTGLGFIGTIVNYLPDGTVNVIGSRSIKNSSSNAINVISTVSGWNSNDIVVEHGHAGEYVCSLKEESIEKILPAFQRIYGEITPEMKVFDVELLDAAQVVSYTKFGSTPLKITVPVPKNIEGNRVHVVTMDQDGQLEKVQSDVITDTSGDKISFTTKHLSVFAIYAMGEDGSVQIDGDIVKNQLSNQKDYTPNTGDYSIHPKWFIALAVIAAGIGFFAYRPKKYKR